ncbi:DUF4375 domain-containing protein [Tardiphaga sp.]|uniref:DMP19 family protein n=1 Tax=Tardiphaga sp. TaxID=1926292 RepID=UPI0025EC6BF1|nr:DUF4375 domain-containing protein [Tardiphaga sp.]
MADIVKPGKDPADFDLSLPEDALALVEDFHGEWYNGGFSQLFANWDRTNIVLIPEALRIIGAPEAAPIVEAAIAEFPDDQDDWRDLASKAMLDPASPLGNKLWELNSPLGDLEDAIQQAAEAFELKLSEDEDL